MLESQDSIIIEDQNLSEIEFLKSLLNSFKYPTDINIDNDKTPSNSSPFKEDKKIKFIQESIHQRISYLYTNDDAIKSHK